MIDPSINVGISRSVSFLDRLLSGRAVYALRDLDPQVGGQLPALLSELRTLITTEDDGTADRLGDLLVTIHLGLLRMELCIEQSPDPDALGPVTDLVARIKEAMSVCDVWLGTTPARAI